MSAHASGHPNTAPRSATVPTTAWLKRGARSSMTSVSRHGSAVRTCLRSRADASTAQVWQTADRCRRACATMPWMDALLAEQVAYYRALAPEYEDHALEWLGRSAEELVAALDAFRPRGEVLELACGPGIWTRHLVRHGTGVTCVDASPEMLAAAERRVGTDRARFECANLFARRRLPQPRGSGVLRRRRLPHPRRDHRQRRATRDSPAAERRHGVPDREGPT